VTLLRGAQLLGYQVLEQDRHHFQIRVGELPLLVEPNNVGWPFEAPHRWLDTIAYPDTSSSSQGRIAGPREMSGSCSTSSDTCVGRLAKDRIKCRRSRSAALTSLCFPSPTCFGSPLVALFNGENIPLAAGSIQAACCSLPSKERKRFIGT
jgi:hypothetical protein